MRIRRIEMAFHILVRYILRSIIEIAGEFVTRELFAQPFLTQGAPEIMSL